MLLRCLSSSFGSIWEEMWFKEFQDGRCGREWNNFSNSKSLCCSDSSHQVSAQSDLWFGRKCPLKNNGSHLVHRNGRILAILNLHVATMPPTKFQLNPTYGSGEDVENVKS